MSPNTRHCVVFLAAAVILATPLQVFSFKDSIEAPLPFLVSSNASFPSIVCIVQALVILVDVCLTAPVAAG
jgi:hypothetical protein